MRIPLTLERLAEPLPLDILDLEPHNNNNIKRIPATICLFSKATATLHTRFRNNTKGIPGAIC